MRAFERLTAGVLCAVAVYLAPAVSAQMRPDDMPREADADACLRTADLVNLLRMVMDPSPSPVLASPADRAVSIRTGQTPVGSASPQVVTVLPDVILPAIEVPEEDADVADDSVVETKPDDPAPVRVVIAPGEEFYSDKHPPFHYAFFFGEYVPYYKGWYYYSDMWYWGRRAPRPPEPPGWIPPPRPPRPAGDRPDPGPPPPPHREEIARDDGIRTGSAVRSGVSSSRSQSSTLPVVPSRHRVPREVETETGPLPKDTRIPVSANQHRISGAAARQITLPQKNSNIPVAPGAHRIPRKNDR